MKKQKRLTQIPSFIAWLLFITTISCTGKQQGNEKPSLLDKIESAIEGEQPDDYQVANAMLVLPRHPAPGGTLRIVTTGGSSIGKAKLIVQGPKGEVNLKTIRSGNELPYWRIDEFGEASEGKYNARILVDDKEVCHLDFEVAPAKSPTKGNNIWTTERGWDGQMETLYAAWINALFAGCDEQTSWSALHEVTQDKDRNFLYDFLSLGEDDIQSTNHVVMEPDCADNPFFLRAYFAWKLGLPFGFHVCDRGYVGKSPQAGQWVTNQTPSSKSNPVQAFNLFIRRIMDGVHSGTARTALKNDNSDYYPVALNREGLRPGTVFADPYGHTLILVSWIRQTKDKPGLLLAVDAQPDKSVAIKRFWKGNFLFNTSEVIGEPGFKAFRPIEFEDGKTVLKTNETLHASPGIAAYSLEQYKMKADSFYLAMDRLINPKPLDPKVALNDLINALHEQLLVRVKSVANGEKFMQSHPGTVIAMPSNANAVFQAGGPWEDFSTPNRDLRLLIAMDAVIEFPDRVAKYPQDYDLPKSSSPEDIKAKLQALLEEQIKKLTITYTRTDGSAQELTIAELLSRREAFEIAYNPNDGPEIRWGAPVGSSERSTCHRHAPTGQQNTMEAVRKWFHSRLHPPT